MVYDIMVCKLEKKNGGKTHYYSPSPLTVVVIEGTVGSRDVGTDPLLVIPSLIR